jgi:hypothetical protein
MIEIKCKRCGKKTLTYPCFIKRGKKFCSAKCQNDIEKVFITCKKCGKIKQVKPYLKNQIYCSTECRKTQTKVPCSTCGKIFERKSCLVDRYKYHFCSKECNTTCFQKGQKVWNKNKKGIHLSPQSEFKKGIISLTKRPIGTVLVRVRHRDGQKRQWIKTEQPSKWVQNSRFVWTSVYGEIPKGYCVHHKDRNVLNDDISNLDCLTRSEHIAEHRGELYTR